ncbi:MAG: hypothetical protein WDW38_001063 [Sanguina aurantia]
MPSDEWISSETHKKLRDELKTTKALLREQHELARKAQTAPLAHIATLLAPPSPTSQLLPDTHSTSPPFAASPFANAPVLQQGTGAFAAQLNTPPTHRAGFGQSAVAGSVNQVPPEEAAVPWTTFGPTGDSSHSMATYQQAAASAAVAAAAAAAAARSYMAVATPPSPRSSDNPFCSSFGETVLSESAAARGVAQFQGLTVVVRASPSRAESLQLQLVTTPSLMGDEHGTPEQREIASLRSQLEDRDQQLLLKQRLIEQRQDDDAMRSRGMTQSFSPLAAPRYASTTAESPGLRSSSSRLSQPSSPAPLHHLLPHTQLQTSTETLLPELPLDFTSLNLHILTTPPLLPSASPTPAPSDAVHDALHDISERGQGQQRQAASHEDQNDERQPQPNAMFSHDDSEVGDSADDDSQNEVQPQPQAVSFDAQEHDFAEVYARLEELSGQLAEARLTIEQQRRLAEDLRAELASARVDAEDYQQQQQLQLARLQVANRQTAMASDSASRQSALGGAQPRSSETPPSLAEAPVSVTGDDDEVLSPIAALMSEAIGTPMRVSPVESTAQLDALSAPAPQVPSDGTVLVGRITLEEDMLEPCPTAVETSDAEAALAASRAGVRALSMPSPTAAEGRGQRLDVRRKVSFSGFDRGVDVGDLARANLSMSGSAAVTTAVVLTMEQVMLQFAALERSPRGGSTDPRLSTPMQHSNTLFDQPGSPAQHPDPSSPVQDQCQSPPRIHLTDPHADPNSPVPTPLAGLPRFGSSVRRTSSGGVSRLEPPVASSPAISMATPSGAMPTSNASVRSNQLYGDDGADRSTPSSSPQHAFFTSLATAAMQQQQRASVEGATDPATASPSRATALSASAAASCEGDSLDLDLDGAVAAGGGLQGSSLSSVPEAWRATETSALERELLLRMSQLWEVTSKRTEALERAGALERELAGQRAAVDAAATELRAERDRFAEAQGVSGRLLDALSRSETALIADLATARGQLERSRSPDSSPDRAGGSVAMAAQLQHSVARLTEELSQRDQRLHTLEAGLDTLAAAKEQATQDHTRLTALLQAQQQEALARLELSAAAAVGAVRAELGSAQAAGAAARAGLSDAAAAAAAAESGLARASAGHAAQVAELARAHTAALGEQQALHEADLAGSSQRHDAALGLAAGRAAELAARLGHAELAVGALREANVESARAGEARARCSEEGYARGAGEMRREHERWVRGSEAARAIEVGRLQESHLAVAASAAAEYAALAGQLQESADQLRSNALDLRQQLADTRTQLLTVNALSTAQGATLTLNAQRLAGLDTLQQQLRDLTAQLNDAHTLCSHQTITLSLNTQRLAGLESAQQQLQEVSGRLAEACTLSADQATTLALNARRLAGADTLQQQLDDAGVLCSDQSVRIALHVQHLEALQRQLDDVRQRLHDAEALSADQGAALALNAQRLAGLDSLQQQLDRANTLCSDQGSLLALNVQRLGAMEALQQQLSEVSQQLELAAMLADERSAGIVLGEQRPRAAALRQCQTQEAEKATQLSALESRLRDSEAQQEQLQAMRHKLAEGTVHVSALVDHLRGAEAVQSGRTRELQQTLAEASSQLSVARAQLRSAEAERGRLQQAQHASAARAVQSSEAHRRDSDAQAGRVREVQETLADNVLQLSALEAQRGRLQGALAADAAVQLSASEAQRGRLQEVQQAMGQSVVQLLALEAQLQGFGAQRERVLQLEHTLARSAIQAGASEAHITALRACLDGTHAQQEAGTSGARAQAAEMREGARTLQEASCRLQARLACSLGAAAARAGETLALQAELGVMAAAAAAAAAAATAAAAAATADLATARGECAAEVAAASDAAATARQECAAEVAAASAAAAAARDGWAGQVAAASADATAARRECALGVAAASASATAASEQSAALTARVLELRQEHAAALGAREGQTASLEAELGVLRDGLAGSVAELEQLRERSSANEWETSALHAQVLERTTSQASSAAITASAEIAHLQAQLLRSESLSLDKAQEWAAQATDLRQQLDGQSSFAATRLAKIAVLQGQVGERETAAAVAAAAHVQLLQQVLDERAHHMEACDRVQRQATVGAREQQAVAGLLRGQVEAMRIRAEEREVEGTELLAAVQRAEGRLLEVTGQLASAHAASQAQARGRSAAAAAEAAGLQQRLEESRSARVTEREEADRQHADAHAAVTVEHAAALAEARSEADLATAAAKGEADHLLDAANADIQSLRSSASEASDRGRASASAAAADAVAVEELHRGQMSVLLASLAAAEVLTASAGGHATAFEACATAAVARAMEAEQAAVQKVRQNDALTRRVEELLLEAGAAGRSLAEAGDRLQGQQRAQQQLSDELARMQFMCAAAEERATAAATASVEHAQRCVALSEQLEGLSEQMEVLRAESRAAEQSLLGASGELRLQLAEQQQIADEHERAASLRAESEQQLGSARGDGSGRAASGGAHLGSQTVAAAAELPELQAWKQQAEARLQQAEAAAAVADRERLQQAAVTEDLRVLQVQAEVRSDVAAAVAAHRIQGLHDALLEAHAGRERDEAVLVGLREAVRDLEVGKALAEVRAGEARRAAAEREAVRMERVADLEAGLEDARECMGRDVERLADMAARLQEEVDRRNALDASTTERIAHLEETLRLAGPAGAANANANAALVDTLQHTVATLHAQLRAAADACDAAAHERIASAASLREAEQGRGAAEAERGRAAAELQPARAAAAAALQGAAYAEAALRAATALRVAAQADAAELRAELRQVRALLAGLIQAQEGRLQQQREQERLQLALLGHSLPVTPLRPLPPNIAPPQLSVAARLLLAGRAGSLDGRQQQQQSHDGVGSPGVAAGVPEEEELPGRGQTAPPGSSSMMAVAAIGEQIAALRTQLALKQGRIAALEGRHAEGVAPLTPPDRHTTAELHTLSQELNGIQGLLGDKLVTLQDAMRTHSASRSGRQARVPASPETVPHHQFSNAPTPTPTTTSPDLLAHTSFPTLHAAHAATQPSQSLAGGLTAGRRAPYLPPTAFSASTVAALSASIATTMPAASSTAAPTAPPNGGGASQTSRTLPAPSPEAITSLARSLAQSMGDAMQGNMLRLLPPTPTASCSGHVNDSSGGWADATSASPIQHSTTPGAGGGVGGRPLSAEERTAAAPERSAGAAAVARQRALYDMESMADPAELPFAFSNFSGGDHGSTTGVEAALEAQAAAAAAAAAALAAAVQRTRQQQALSAQQQPRHDAHSLWNPGGHSPEAVLPRGRPATGPSHDPRVSSSGSSRPGRDRQGSDSSGTVAGSSAAPGMPTSTAAEARMLAAARLQQLGLDIPAGSSVRAGPASEGANSLSPAPQTVRVPPGVPLTPPAYKDWTPVDQSLASQIKPRLPPANVSPAWIPPGGGTANIPARAASPLNSLGAGLNIGRSSAYANFPAAAAAQYAQSESGGVPTRRSAGSGVLSGARARNAAASQAAELSTPVRRSTSHVPNLPASRYTTPYLMMLQTLKPGTPHEGVIAFAGGSTPQGATDTPQSGVRTRHSTGGNEGGMSMSPVAAGSDQRKSTRRTFYSSGIGAAVTYDSFDAL